MGDKCVENNEICIFEIDECFGPNEKRNATCVEISHVDDLAISGTDDFTVLLPVNLEMNPSLTFSMGPGDLITYGDY